MGVALQHNIGNFILSVPILSATNAVQTFSSNGAPNITEVVGRVIDRLALGRHYLSAKVIVPFGFSGTGGSTTPTLTFTSRVLHGTSTNPATALGSTGVVTSWYTSATSTTYVGAHEQIVDLRTASRYLRVNITPNFVASSSGFVSYGAALVFGGGDEVPASAVAALTVTT
jgi:hypothetical protein